MEDTKVLIAQTDAEGGIELRATPLNGGAALVVENVEDDEEALTHARLFLEGVCQAQAKGDVASTGGVWVVQTVEPSIQIVLRARVAAGSLFSRLSGDAENSVTLEDPVTGETPLAAIASWLTAEGYSQVHTAPLVALECLTKSVAAFPGSARQGDDSSVGPRNNSNNYLAWAGLSELAADKGDYALADTHLRAALQRSWSFQLASLGGRLSKVEVFVSAQQIEQMIGAFTRAGLQQFDQLDTAEEQGLRMVPSPIFSFGPGGRATVQLLPMTSAHLELFFVGAGRAVAEDPATHTLAAEALAKHAENATPLVRVMQHCELFDSTFSAESLSVSLEYMPPFRMWTTIPVLLAQCELAGMTLAEKRAYLSLDDAADIALEANQKMDALRDQIQVQINETIAALSDETIVR